MNDKPHIARVRGYNWEVYRSKNKRRLIALAQRFSRLREVGPWRPAKTTADWFGDAKP